MTKAKKQLKITKLLSKGAKSKPSEDNDEMYNELRQLEEKLREKQNEYFQIQRNSYRKRVSASKMKEQPFVRPHKIILNNSIETLKRNIDLMSMLTGVEVQSYVADDHCCIVYQLQHNSEHIVKHGLRIDMKYDGNEISKLSLPLGFNLEAIKEEFDDIMMPNCLGAIGKALVAYYDRLEQYEHLQKLLNIEAELFKTLDSSHIEISFFVQNSIDADDEQTSITLTLDYRIYDVRPKSYSFVETELPDGAAEILKQQCSVFKKKLLSIAFKEAFMSDIGTYRLVQQLGPRRVEKQRRPQKRFRPNKNYYNNDDTFQPEDCSDQGDDDHCSD